MTGSNSSVSFVLFKPQEATARGRRGGAECRTGVYQVLSLLRSQWSIMVRAYVPLS